MYRRAEGAELEMVQSVLANWPLPEGQVTADKLTHRDKDAAHFRIQMVGNADLFVKGRKSLPDGPSIEREVRVAGWLYENGVKVPKPLVARTGAQAIRHLGWAWSIFDFVEGDGFSGAAGELDSAVREFSRLAYVGRAWKEDYVHQPVRNLIAEIVDLISRPQVSAWVAELISIHGDDVREAVSRVVNCADVIERNIGLTHVDFHPRNMIVANGEIKSLLDFEDVRLYPIQAASGFAAFKLIRQVAAYHRNCVTKAFLTEQCAIWRRGWREFSQDADIADSELADGARYIVLQLIHFILSAHIVKADDRYLDDLEKQLLSLAEITEIFG
jgi:hypothetical protein